MKGPIILVIKWLDRFSYIKKMHHRLWFWNLLAWAGEAKPQSPGTVHFVLLNVNLYFWICQMTKISIKRDKKVI